MKLAMPNLARPDLAFVLPWTVVLVAYLIIPPTLLTPKFEPEVAVMLGFNMIAAPVIYVFVVRMYERRHGRVPELSRPSLSSREAGLLRRFFWISTTIWAASYLASIVYSGGLPIVWAIVGNGKTYADFGLPSVGGLSNMFRCLSMVMAVLLFVTTRRYFYLLLLGAFFLSCFAELSRSGLFVVLCYSLCTFFLLSRIRFGQMMLGVLVLAVAAALFIWVGSLRQIDIAASDFNVDALAGLPVGVYWAWAYIANPLGNVNHAAALGLHPLGYPYFTTISVLPTVIRNLFYANLENAYPVPLITPSLNATTAYGPLCADFGFAGAALAMTALQLVATYAYVAARHGRVLYICLYPALFTSLALSVFYIYAVTPGVILFPVVCWALVRFMRSHLAFAPAPSQNFGTSPR